MSLFDFDKLSRPTSRARPIDPIEIFRSAPALAETPNDLWRGQSKALESWHGQRTQRDILISLHTGAGKCLVGLLATQSLLNEGLTRVLYACATNDLVIQTSREIDSKLGFPYTTRMGGQFSNNLYATGQGFCITNYQALFNSRSVFRRDLCPEAIIFDDAHVAEKTIRDCFTLKIDKEKLPEVYIRIIELIRPHFIALRRPDYYDGIIAGTSAYRVLAVPPNAIVALDRDKSLLALLRGADQEQGNIGFALGHLADRLDRCAIFISKQAIEICHPFLPSKRIPFLTDPDIRRIYLSATLTSEVDFCRAFGKKPAVRIEPESDAGIGERLIILADRDSLSEGGTKGVTDERLARVLGKNHKLLISTPSYIAAAKYKSIAAPPSNADFSNRLDQFRKSTAPATFVLVGRVDGIDLPHATCRVMLADELPMGFSLLENYLYDYLEMRNSFAAKLANRITQMFGRVNRGRNDYSVIFITGRNFVNWLSTSRNIALLPELLRKQLLLGKSLMDQFKVKEIQAFPQLTSQVINRDGRWLNYYKDSIEGLDVGEDQRQQAKEDDKLLTEAALAEAEFTARMWDGTPALAREALGLLVDRVVVADRRLAAWYNVQMGHTFEIEGDGDAAAKQYSQAKSRANHILALPSPSTVRSLAEDQKPKNLLHRRLLSIFANDIRYQNDEIARFERLIKPLFDATSSSSEHEEALRSFGDLLGFEATRPEQESDNESTLDVLWLSPTSRQAILLALKTKKKANGAINLEEVGQGFNHLQWMESAHKGIASLGLIFVCNSQTCTKAATPSSEMWIAGVEKFKALYDDTIQMLLALQRLKPLERYAEINALCMRAEWQPEAIFERVRGQRLLEVKK